MDEKSKKPQRMALGRGLSALISSNAVPVASPMVSSMAEAASNPSSADKIVEMPRTNNQLVRYVSINSVLNNPEQPRTDFKQQELEELSGSIKQLGVLQPVLVRPSRVSPDGFEIVAGERRWRAAKLAGVSQLPVIVKDLSDKEMLEISIVENVQRENLNPIEQAKAFQRLSDSFSLSHEEIADRVGKDRATVSNAMRLLKLPKEVQELLSDSKISVGHAKTLLAIKDAHAQISLAKKVVAEELSVRDLEGLVSRVVVLDAGKPIAREKNLAALSKIGGEFSDSAEKLRRVLGTKVGIKARRGGKGKIEIEYFSEAELDRILELIFSLEKA